MSIGNGFDINTLLNGVLQENIYGEAGGLLLSKGTKVTEKHLLMLKKHQLHSSEQEKVPIKQLEQLVDEVKVNIDHLRNFIRSRENITADDIDEPINTFSTLLEEMINTHYLVEFIRVLQRYDNSVYCHSINVGLLAGMIGKLLGFPNKVNHLLGQMGFLHDIGKIKIDPAILNKPAKLSSEEYAEMKNHTIYGYDILKENKSINRFILLGALLHHERLDGTGYPFGMKGERLPFCVQILAVADTYEAMTAKRTYSRQKSPLHAVEELRREVFEGKLNAIIILPFTDYIMRQMLNQEVVLNNDKVGKIVCCFEENPASPLILVDNECIDLRKRDNLFIV
jgi:HD-GYP domain-containing protein (c-di-GMP phosphodiesterase class II)